MKQKLLVLTLAFMGCTAAQAGTGDDPGTGARKRDELNGVVINGETRKPMKDVTVTAYLVTNKKEKVEITDEDGGFSFDELKPGVYKFVFEKAGFRKITKEKVVIKTDEAFQINIEMIENSDYEIIPSPFHIGDF